MLTPRRLGALTTAACLALCLAPAGAGARGSCASFAVRPRLVHHIAPPQNFVSSLSVLRRPQTPADLQGFEVNESFYTWRGGGVPEIATISVIDADYIRRLGSVGGSPEYLVPARVRLAAPMSRRCLRRLSVKARRHQLKLERADRARGVVLLFTGPNPESAPLGKGDTYSQLINEGLFTSSQAADAPGVESGIVPDGVSSVALLLENNRAVLPSPNVEITAQVTANFFSIEIPPPRLATVGPATLIWRDASGRTLKSVPQSLLL
jgi:hypothetical protein